MHIVKTITKKHSLIVRLLALALGEAWDNDGQMVVPDGDAEITGVLVALDCTTRAVKKAKELGCNVIVTHHPLIFRPLSALTDGGEVGKRVLQCVQNGISVLSYHSRLDCVSGGVNDCLAEALGIADAEAFVPYGRVGEVQEQSFETFAQRVKDALQTELCAVVKASDKTKRVAVIAGCGKDEIADVLKTGADTFVTGEVMHSHMIECKEMGLNLICATHYATERVVLPFLRSLVEASGARTLVLPFEREAEYGI